MMHDSFIIRVDDPILAGHAVRGLPVLPGMAYVDILYQFFREQGHDLAELELRNVSLHQPLTTGDRVTVHAEIHCTEIGASGWRVLVEGGYEAPGAGPRTRFLTAEMHRVARTIFADSIDLNAPAGAGGKPVELEKIYTACRTLQLVHQGVMKIEGSVHSSAIAHGVTCRLPEVAVAEAGDFIFHPALLDGSGLAVAAAFAAAMPGEQRLFLPLSFGSFRAAAPWHTGRGACEPRRHAPEK